MKNYLKIIFILAYSLVILAGCTSTPIMPDGEVTPNDEIDVMIEI